MRTQPVSDQHARNGMSPLVCIAMAGLRSRYEIVGDRYALRVRYHLDMRAQESAKVTRFESHAMQCSVVPGPSQLASLFFPVQCRETL